MQEGDGKNASEARFIRKKRKEGGYDEEEQQEQRQFHENFQKALKNHSKKQMTKDVEKQVEYFGYKIEPFNMRQEQEMGEIDEDGFFVFNKRKRLRDAWMDSLNENEGQQQIEQLRKKIKQEQRQKNVYQAQKKIAQSDRQDEEQQQEAQQEPENQQNEIEAQNKFEPKEIKLLLSELLPFNTSANQYMKKLKKQKNTQLYDKILLLCNEYIALTSQHDILTLKKQDLQEQQQQEQQQKPLQNWDKDQPSQEKPIKKQKVEEQNKDEDDIF